MRFSHLVGYVLNSKLWDIESNFSNWILWFNDPLVLHQMSHGHVELTPRSDFRVSHTDTGSAEEETYWILTFNWSIYHRFFLFSHPTTSLRVSSTNCVSLVTLSNIIIVLLKLKIFHDGEELILLNYSGDSCRKPNTKPTKCSFITFVFLTMIAILCW